jgi:predicted nucleotidyltransferase
MSDALRHLQPYERQAIQALMADFRARFGEEILQWVIFGSKSRGDDTADSDIDILIITRREDWPFKHRVLRRGARLSLEYGVLFNLFVVSQARWRRMQQIHYPLYQTVSREGIPLTPQLLAAL